VIPAHAEDGGCVVDDASGARCQMALAAGKDQFIWEPSLQKSKKIMIL